MTALAAGGFGTSVPAAFSGSIRPDGWNWTSSGSRIRPPASTAGGTSHRSSSRQDDVRDLVLTAGREDHRVVDDVAPPVVRSNRAPNTSAVPDQDPGHVDEFELVPSGPPG